MRISAARRRIGQYPRADVITPWKIVRRLSTCLALALIGCGPANPPVVTSPPLAASKLIGTCEVRSTPDQWTAVLTNQVIQTGSILRTGPNSLLELSSTSTADRIRLANDSEATIGRWVQRPSSPGNDHVEINLREGLALIDLSSPMTGASLFEIKGSNFVAQVRSGGTIAAISVDGFVLVQTGTVVCVLVSPTGTPKPAGFTVKAGQMLDPLLRAAGPIPASSNVVWNVLTK
jgi:hypothetical protein